MPICSRTKPSPSASRSCSNLAHVCTAMRRSMCRINSWPRTASCEAPSPPSPPARHRGARPPSVISRWLGPAAQARFCHRHGTMPPVSPGALRLIAVIPYRPLIRRILTHLNLVPEPRRLPRRAWSKAALPGSTSSPVTDVCGTKQKRGASVGSDAVAHLATRGMPRQRRGTDEARLAAP
jgi:hypothetical protein